MKKLALALFALLLSPLAFSQELSPGGILYGSNWGCLVKAPEGWSMDQTSLSKYNIYGLFYEDGKKFGGTTPIIYINTSKLNAATDEELQKYINWDLDNVTKAGATVVDLKRSYPHFANKSVTYQIDHPNGQLETVVYTRYKDGAFLIVLSARDAATRTSLDARLAEVIDAMSFMDKTE